MASVLAAVCSQSPGHLASTGAENGELLRSVVQTVIRCWGGGVGGPALGLGTGSSSIAKAKSQCSGCALGQTTAMRLYEVHQKKGRR